MGMRRLLLLISIILAIMMVSCNRESTTTYDYLRLSWALDRSEEPITISFTNKNGTEEQVISFLYKSISMNETLYFVRSPDWNTPASMNDMQTYYQNDFFEKRNIAEYYAYIILTNNEHPKPDRIRIVLYDELAEIFADYIQSNPIPEETTTAD